MVTLGTSVISEAPGKFNLGSRKPEDTTRWIWAGVLELWAVVCGVLHVGRHIFSPPGRGTLSGLRNGFGGLFQFLMKIQLVSDTQRRPLLNLLPLLPPSPQKKHFQRAALFPHFLPPPHSERFPRREVTQRKDGGEHQSKNWPTSCFAAAQ